jgi:hypothetical protein
MNVSRILLMLSVLSPLTGLSAAESSRKPNVVVFLAAQLTTLLE